MKKIQRWSVLVRVAVVVLMAGISPLVGISGAFAANMPLTMSVQGSSTIVPGAQSSYTVTVANNGTSIAGAVVDFEIDNSAGQKVYQQFFAGQNISGGQTVNVSAVWTPSAAGVYVAKVGVFSTNWANLLAWNNNARTITVVASVPKFTAAADNAGPQALTVGTAGTFGAAVTNIGSGAASNAIVMLEVADAAGTNVHQQLFYGQNLTPGQSQQYSVSWTPSATGNYTLNVGVFAENWSALLGWVADVSPFTVSAPVSYTVANLVQASQLYVDPNSQAAQAAAALRLSDPADAAKIGVIASHAAAVWFGGWNTNVYQDVDNVVSAAAAKDQVPVLVAYNIPNRDCGGYSAGGATSASAYEQWIQAFANGIGARRAIVILEPDALADMGCLSAADQATRLQLLSNAVTMLKSLGETSVYIDAGNPNWIPAGTMAQRLTAANVAAADGFAVNASNYYSTAQNEQYGDALSALVNGKHYVIDTGRNGSGPAPAGVWCNAPGMALGSFPASVTNDSRADYFLWIKPPGESDGTCNGGPSAGTFWPQYAESLVSNAGL